VSYKEFTYEQLKGLMDVKAGQADMPARTSIGNLNSALLGFLESVGIEASDQIGSNLRLSFYKRRRSYLARLVEEGRPSSYLANQKSYLKVWHAFLVQLDKEEATLSDKPMDHPFQGALKTLFMSDKHGNRATIKGTCRALGIPLSTVRGWLLGNAPKFAAYGSVIKIERFFGLDEGALIDLLPGRKKATRAASKTKVAKAQLPTLEYRARLSKLNGDNYSLTAERACPTLRTWWIKMLEARTRLTSADQNPHRWSSRTEPNRRVTADDWYYVINGKVAYTARWSFCQTRRYFGFLQLATARGGLGMEPEVAQSLAQFTNIEALGKFIDWKVARADDNVSGDVTGFLRLAKTLCNPQFGFLPQNPKLGDTIGVTDAGEWKQLCEKAHAFAKSQHNRMRKLSGKSRDPFAPIKAVVDLPNPLTAVRDALTRHRMARPTSGGRRESLWVRDHLLMSILASNPLRPRNIRQLTWSPDNQGQLHQDTAGRWRIRIRKRDIKAVNSSAVAEGDYDSGVQQELWKTIELYLREYRPKLCGQTPSNLFFICPDAPDKEWRDMERHFARLFGRYFVGCHPSGPYCMRHIIATAILKISPGAYAKAAKTLHDRIETVMRHYAHLQPDDSSDILASAFSDRTGH
jgi:hypothetical protein